MFGRNNWTKWVALAPYNWGHTSKIVFMRGNKKTGEMQFKSKRVVWDSHGNVLPKIETQLNWDTVVKLINDVA